MNYWGFSDESNQKWASFTSHKLVPSVNVYYSLTRFWFHFHGVWLIFLSSDHKPKDHALQSVFWFSFQAQQSQLTCFGCGFMTYGFQTVCLCWVMSVCRSCWNINVMLKWQELISGNEKVKDACMQNSDKFSYLFLDICFYQNCSAGFLKRIEKFKSVLIKSLLIVTI